MKPDYSAMAAELAKIAHHGQTRVTGLDYFTHHVLPVATKLMLDPEAFVVGLLHDTVEDTPVTLESLTAFGFTPETVAAVDALTRRDGEAYTDFTLRVGKDKLASKVKLADLEHNMEDMPAEKESLRKRYEKARAFLVEMHGDLLK